MERTLQTSLGAITLRPTRGNDVASLRELRLEALWMHPEAFSSDHADSAAKPAKFWAERVRAGSGEDGIQITYIAEAADGEFVGMCGIYREPGPKVRHAGHIWGVYVRPAWRGLKIADALMDCCETWAREQGVRIVQLAVTTTNSAAFRCYQRRGYTVCGTVHESIHTNNHYYDEHLMAKRLK